MHLAESRCLKQRQVIEIKHLLDVFVQQFPSIYTARHHTQVVHSLVHVSKTIANFGPLQNFSTFSFESILGKYFDFLKLSWTLPFQGTLRHQFTELVCMHKKSKTILLLFDLRQLILNERISTSSWSYSTQERVHSKYNSVLEPLKNLHSDLLICLLIDNGMQMKVYLFNCSFIVKCLIDFIKFSL